MSTETETWLREQAPFSFSVRRFAGEDRYDTSKEMVDYLMLTDKSPYKKSGLTFCVASGSNFADALAAGPVCGNLGIYLVILDDGVGEDFIQRPGHLDFCTAIVVGGENSISDDLCIRISNTLQRYAYAE